jgi:glutaminyl-peptide cyclotransferase
MRYTRPQFNLCLLLLLGLILIGCRQGMVAPAAPTAVPTSVVITIPPTQTPTPTAAERAVAYYTYEIVNQFPHDPEAFTQGLVYKDKWLYESTGLYGRSSLRHVDLETGEVVQIHTLPDQYFGEGLTIWEDRIIQLTWRENTGFIYDKDSFELLDTFTYPTEGWGLTHDGQQLIMSDGSDTLYFLDPNTFAENGRIQVRDERGDPVVRLNEMAYIEGEIYANVWMTNQIVRIDPATGYVTGWIDLSGILDDVPLTGPVDVLNGVAYDAENGRLFVTGKLYPRLFEIRLIEQQEP